MAPKSPAPVPFYQIFKGNLFKQLNDRQRQAITLLKTAGRLSNADYQKLTNAIKKTASRDLEDLRRKGVVQKIG
jgi:Fic family protein